jgi:hypothetical protein
MFARTALVALFAVTSVACAAAHDGELDEESEAAIDEELTSATALSRSLSFQGSVFVSETASDSIIVSTIQKQNQSMFGALRTSSIGVNSRELKAVDPSTFVKTKVTVVDPTTSAKSTMLKVTYKYTDMAVVPKSMARRSALPLALLGNGYSWKTDRILKECTANDSHAQEFSSSIWYVFEPTVSTCKTAIATEQKAIDAHRQKLATGEVSKLEVERLYIPTTVRLGGDKTNKGNSYPEYDRLWSGGVKPNTLVIGMVNGMIDHDHGHPVDDSGYRDWMETIREVGKVRPGMKVTKIEPAVDLTTATVNGKTYTGLSFDSAMKWKLDGTGFPTGLSYADREALQKAYGDKLVRHWITLSVPVTVKIGTNAAKKVNLEILTYFGAESDSTPHKFAIKNSDVFIYNGHSYIGYGPLDPSRFTASDFPSSYQIMFIDGCVSYNYYERDYIPLKSGGTRNLDLITNGLEAPSWRSGWALGQFLGKLVNGKQESYLSLLQAASATDELRVVDGELDNVYSPSKTPITVQ